MKKQERSLPGEGRVITGECAQSTLQNKGPLSKGDFPEPIQLGEGHFSTSKPLWPPCLTWGVRVEAAEKHYKTLQKAQRRHTERLRLSAKITDTFPPPYFPSVLTDSSIMTVDDS